MSEPRDPQRLAALARYDLRSPAAREALDGLAERAANLAGSPIGLVSVVLDDAQFFAGRHGLDGWLDAVGGTPIEWSFCADVVRSEDALEVPDAHANARYATNPLVTEDGVRCYLGVPLRTEDGHVLGSLCVIGTDERQFEDHLHGALRSLADEVVAALPRRA